MAPSKTVVETVKMMNVSQDAESSPLVHRSPSLVISQSIDRAYVAASTDRIKNSLDESEWLLRREAVVPVKRAESIRESIDEAASGHKSGRAVDLSIGHPPSPQQRLAPTYQNEGRGKLRVPTGIITSRKPPVPTQSGVMTSTGLSDAQGTSTTQKEGVKAGSKKGKNLSHADRSIAHPAPMSESGRSATRLTRAAKKTALEALSSKYGARPDATPSNIPSSPPSAEAPNTNSTAERRRFEGKATSEFLHSANQSNFKSKQGKSVIREKLDLPKNGSADPSDNVSSAALLKLDGHAVSKVTQDIDNEARQRGATLTEQNTAPEQKAFTEAVRLSTPASKKRKRITERRDRSFRAATPKDVPSTQSISRRSVLRQPDRVNNSHQEDLEHSPDGTATIKGFPRSAIHLEDTVRQTKQSAALQSLIGSSSRKGTIATNRGPSLTEPTKHEAAQENVIMLSDNQASSSDDDSTLISSENESLLARRIERVAKVQDTRTQATSHTNSRFEPLPVSNGLSKQGSIGLAYQSHMEDPPAPVQSQKPIKAAAAAQRPVSSREAAMARKPLIHTSSHVRSSVALQITRAESSGSNVRSVKGRDADTSNQGNVAESIEDALSELTRPQANSVQDPAQLSTEHGHKLKTRDIPSQVLTTSTSNDVISVASKASKNDSTIRPPAKTMGRISSKPITRTALQVVMPPPARRTEVGHLANTPSAVNPTQPTATAPDRSSTSIKPSNARLQSASVEMTIEEPSKRMESECSSKENEEHELNKRHQQNQPLSAGLQTVDIDGSPIPPGLVIHGDMTALDTFVRQGIGLSSRVTSETSTERELLRDQSRSRQVTPHRAPDTVRPSDVSSAQNHMPGQENDESHDDHFQAPCVPTRPNGIGITAKRKGHPSSAGNAGEQIDPKKTCRRESHHPPISSFKDKIVAYMKTLQGQPHSQRSRRDTSISRSRHRDHPAKRHPLPQPPGDPATGPRDMNYLLWYTSLKPWHAKHFDMLLVQARHSTQRLVASEDASYDGELTKVGRLLAQLRQRDKQHHADMQDTLAECSDILREAEATASTASKIKHCHKEFSKLKSRLEKMEASIAKIL